MIITTIILSFLKIWFMFMIYHYHFIFEKAWEPIILVSHFFFFLVFFYRPFIYKFSQLILLCISRVVWWLFPKCPGLFGIWSPNLFVFLIGYSLQWETPSVIYAMMDHTLILFLVGLRMRPSWEGFPTAKLLVWGPSKTLVIPKLCSHFLSCLSPQFCSNSFFSFPSLFYTLPLEELSWWQNIPYVCGSYQFWDLGDSLCLHIKLFIRGGTWSFDIGEII